MLGWFASPLAIPIFLGLGFATLRIAMWRGCPKGERPRWFVAGVLFPILFVPVAFLMAGPSRKLRSGTTDHPVTPQA